LSIDTAPTFVDARVFIRVNIFVYIVVANLRCTSSEIAPAADAAAPDGPLAGKSEGPELEHSKTGQQSSPTFAGSFSSRSRFRRFFFAAR
jgi:hypothetical protein